MAESADISSTSQIQTVRSPGRSGAREAVCTPPLPRRAVCTPPLPRRCRPLAHQVAGHRYGQGKTKKGMLQHEDGTLLKPLQPPPRGQKELGFYQKVFDEDDTNNNQDLLTLRQFMPNYLGKFVPEDDPSQVFIKLEDITRKFHQPCILDVKVGRRCYDLEATPDKIEREKKKYPPIDIVGFQLMGMRIYKRKTGEVVYYDKKYGRSLDENHVGKGLTKYLTMDGTCPLQVGVLQAILSRLQKIKRFIQTQSQICLFSSSLLIVYEGDSTEQNSAESSTEYSTEKLHADSDHSSPLVLAARDGISLHHTQTLSNSTEAHSKQERNRERCELSRRNVLDSQPLAPQHSFTSEQEATKVKNVNGPQAQASDSESKGKTGPTDQHTTATSHSGSQRNMEADRLQGVEDGLSYPIREDVTDCAGLPANHKVDVRMIDFAHVFPSDHVDKNYLYGIKNLISYLEKIHP